MLFVHRSLTRWVLILHNYVPATRGRRVLSTTDGERGSLAAGSTTVHSVLPQHTTT